MVGMLFNNILYCFSDIYIISYLLDFIIGNSITTTFLLYVCSYVFGFCKWHRFIWFRNINKNELDNKIIESAITFYFKDEDSGSTKTWNYFKTAN